MENVFKDMSEKDWRENLTDEQFRSLREKGTERRFTGEYVDKFDDVLDVIQSYLTQKISLNQVVVGQALMNQLVMMQLLKHKTIVLVCYVLK